MTRFEPGQPPAARRTRRAGPRAASDGQAGAQGPPRRSSRVAIGLQRPVTVEVSSGGGGHADIAGRMTSLSPTGAFLELATDYPIGCALHLCFRLPPHFTTIGCSAVVRSGRWGRGVGVEFVDLAQPDREHIRTFVAGPASTP